MGNKNFLLIMTVFFSVIAALHALRIFLGWEAVIGGATIPFWASWAAILAAGCLAIQARKLCKKIK